MTELETNTYDVPTDDDGEEYERPASYARLQWEAGEARLERFTEDSRRRALLEDMIEALTGALQQRAGQTIGLEDLAELYTRADGWAQQIVHRMAPEDPWAWDLDVVLDATFHRYARRAWDYVP